MGKQQGIPDTKAFGAAASFSQMQSWRERKKQNNVYRTRGNHFRYFLSLPQGSSQFRPQTGVRKRVFTSKEERKGNNHNHQPREQTVLLELLFFAGFLACAESNICVVSSALQKAQNVSINSNATNAMQLECKDG